MDIKDFKFGIEMEHNIPYGTFVNKVGQLPNGWSVKYEHCGTEVTSPPLVGYKGILTLRSILKRFWDNFDEIKFNDCGLHVHVDISKFSLRHLKRLALLNSHYSDVIFSIMSPVRRKNRYCYPNNFSRKSILDCTSLSNYNTLQKKGRYYGMNIHAFYKYRTVEFRYAEGTLSWHKIYALLSLYLRMVSWAFSSNEIPSFTSASKDSFLDLLELHGNARKLLLSLISKNKKSDNRTEQKTKIVGIRL